LSETTDAWWTRRSIIGRGHGRVAEDLSPAPERLVGSDDDRRSFIAGGYELEEQVGGLCLEWDVADLVDDDERIAAQAQELGVEMSAGMSIGQATDPLGGRRKGNPVPGLAGPDRETDREVGLAGARGSEKDDVLVVKDDVVVDVWPVVPRGPGHNGLLAG
jgi:hypothetical protein